MASFASMKTQILGKIPVDKRSQYETVATAWIEGSIEKISKLWNWDWRKQQVDISVNTTDVNYTLPSDCDMISADNGVLLDSSGNPTKGRVVHLTEDAFNDLYIREQDTTETALTPKYFVPLTQRASNGRMQIRVYPKSDTVYTLRLYYFSKPSSNDAQYMLEDLVLYDVYSKMPVEFEPNATTWANRYLQISRELRPQEAPTAATVPLWTQDPAVREHYRNLASKQSRK